MLRKMIIHSLFLLMILPFNTLAAGRPGPSTQAEVLTLKKCLELALNNNQQIKAAVKRVEIAQAAVKEAKGGSWPKLDYSLFANKAEEAIYPYSTIIFPDAATDYSGAAISLTQPLYLGGKLANGLQLSKVQLSMAWENERQTKQQLTFQVKQAFYQVWLAEQMLKVAQSSYDNLEHHVAQVENFYQVGTVSKFELLRSKVQRDSLKPQVIAAQNDLRFAKLSMAILIGFPKDQPYSVADDFDKLQVPEEFTIAVEQVLESAYQNRPEMRQIKQAEKLNQYQRKIAEAGYKPSITLVGTYEGASLDYIPEHWNDSRLWTLTLNITGNIFDGFATPAKVTGAQKNMELTLIQESGLRDQIKLDVEQSVQNIQESLEVIHANQSNINMAKESLELTEIRFNEGMATTMDIMDSQLALDQALNGYYQGVASYLNAVAKFDLVTGKDICRILTSI
jgi:outer membrane protein